MSRESLGTFTTRIAVTHIETEKRPSRYYPGKFDEIRYTVKDGEQEVTFEVTIDKARLVSAVSGCARNHSGKAQIRNGAVIGRVVSRGPLIPVPPKP
jgi:hypothetical protein